MAQLEKHVVSDPDLAARVRALLQQPFDQALKACPALREYIQNRSDEDAKALEEEFREHWHAEAPLEMRQILEEILDPEVAAANVAATEALLQEKAPTLDQEAFADDLIRCGLVARDPRLSPWPMRPLSASKVRPMLCGSLTHRFGLHRPVAVAPVGASSRSCSRHLSTLPTWLFLLAAILVTIGLPLLMSALRASRAWRGAALGRRNGRSSGGLHAAAHMARRTILDPSKRKRSMAFLLLLFGALALANMAAVAQSYAQRDYMTALAGRDGELFRQKLLWALALLAVMMPARSLAEFAAGGLSQIWRDTLTLGLLNDYFHPKVVYWLRRSGEVADPDMRIAVEAGHFTEMLVLLVRDTFENFLKLIGFLGVVYSISRLLFVVMASYAFFGAFATVKLFGGPLVQLDRNIRAQEA
ncbi:ABC transporter D family member 2, partial [Durusdinium trenchii]